MDQAKLLLERVVGAVTEAEPWMIDGMLKDESTDVIFGNYSRVQVAGWGRRVRGPHPDRIVGDDVLSDETSDTAHQRAKVKRWWFGTVSNMAHPGTYRRLGWGKLRSGKVEVLRYSPSRIILVGTPFHQADLLLSMRTNRMWHFRRYQAEFYPNDRKVNSATGELSMAVEIS